MCIRDRVGGDGVAGHGLVQNGVAVAVADGFVPVSYTHLEESLPFDRAANERCRGISRRESLLVVLGGRPATDEQMQAMMARKQRYYEESLDQIGPDDLLPGVAGLLDALDAAGIPYALASASKNARPVCERLGIAGRLAALADGYSVERQKLSLIHI